MSDRIALARTPNPDAMKFTVPSRLVARGPYEYRRDADHSDSPLAEALFAIDDIELTLIADDFVTVQRKQGADWEALGATVIRTLHDFLGSYQLAVLEPAPTTDSPRDATEQRVVALLDEYVRPAVADDGGEIHFLGVEDGIVRLSMRGACGTCPSSMTTLRMGVERLLREHVPEIRGVENVVA